LSHHRTPAFHRILPFWWYHFQNSPTVREIDLKFYVVIVLGKLEDRMKVFPAGVVHKLRQFMGKFQKFQSFAEK
jgi:hypothetical protein